MSAEVRVLACRGVDSCLPTTTAVVCRTHGRRMVDAECHRRLHRDGGAATIGVMALTDEQVARLTDERFAHTRPDVSRLPQVRRDQLPPGLRWPVFAQSAGLLRFRHQFVPYLHRRFGDTFTVWMIPGGRPLVLFTRPEHTREIFAGDPEIFHAGKGNAILGPIMGEHSLLLQDGGEHKRARKLLMPAFNGAALRGYAGLVTELARAEVGHLADRVDVPLAGPDERPHPRGDPARRLRGHRREPARPAAAARQQDRQHQPGHPARLGLAGAAAVRAVEGAGREPAGARPAHLRRDRRAPPGSRTWPSAATCSPA